MKANRVKALLYCTKSGLTLGATNYSNNCYSGYTIGTKRKSIENFIGSENILNGKIVASCDIETEKIKYRRYHQFDINEGHDKGLRVTIEKDSYYSLIDSTWSSPDFYDLLDKSGMNFDQIDAYLKQKDGYALHISNLYIFKNPEDLNKYNADYSGDYGSFSWTFEENKKVTPLKIAPQNMMKVFDKYGNPYVLISVRPEQLYKILNHIVTIDVRKKVLKEMSKNPYIVRANKFKIKLSDSEATALRAFCSGGKK